ncbi:partitioning defective 6 homolog gamma-like isoform X1 [Varroa jacobsoni]|uniref:Uncharacterized protein n=2 Tax=Varroa destructor TaxID=109461 RepID=A0A7M7MFB3_VARDE|nr:partitioning defective 6 homolog gamma-like isoform X1 [Varroa destructor]XP_022693455.1 partitioning defective 6 homolog gamma-like isoform X1 [Varroa jacobsoni]
MSRHEPRLPKSPATVVEVKSKFDAEFRRFSMERAQLVKFDDFYQLVERFHRLAEVPFALCYTDPIHGDVLPINNDENFARAINNAKPTLRLFVQRKGNQWEGLNSYGNRTRKGFLASYLPMGHSEKTKPQISLPEDFRQVSSIIDVDQVPDTCRRVRLVKHGSDRPLGFYIRDGTSVRVTPQGLEKVPGIFISRLVPGGLAESTGLLAVNDEVLEVNGIEVAGKSLDQVTDMMVANSSNLIVTIRPANQGAGGTGTLLPPRRGSTSRSSQMSHASSGGVSSDVDEDEIRDHTVMSHPHHHLQHDPNHNDSSTSSTYGSSGGHRGTSGGGSGSSTGVITL